MWRLFRILPAGLEASLNADEQRLKRERLAGVFAALPTILPVMDIVYALNTQGDIVSCSLPKAVGQSRANLSYFAELMGGKSIVYGPQIARQEALLDAARQLESVVQALSAAAHDLISSSDEAASAAQKAGVRLGETALPPPVRNNLPPARKLPVVSMMWLLLPRAMPKPWPEQQAMRTK